MGTSFGFVARAYVIGHTGNNANVAVLHMDTTDLGVGQGFKLTRDEVYALLYLHTVGYKTLEVLCLPFSSLHCEVSSA